MMEKHSCVYGTDLILLEAGDIVQVKGDQENCGEWKSDVDTKLIMTRETSVGVKIKMGNDNLLEREIHFQIPFELHSELKSKNQGSKNRQ